MRRKIEWPELPPLPPSIEAGENPREVYRVLWAFLRAFADFWPRIVQALEYLHEWTREHDEKCRLPPMPPLPKEFAPRRSNSRELAKAVGLDVAQKYDAEVRNPSTPAPTMSEVAEMVEQRTLVELLRQERVEALERARARRRERTAIVVAVASIATAIVEHFWGR